MISKDKKAFLLRLLQGQYGSPEWIKERADTYKIDLSRPRYVLTVQINLEKFDEKSPLELSQIKETMHRAIRSIFFEQEDLLYEYDTGETVLLTAGKHSDASQRRRQIEKAAARLYAELREQCKVLFIHRNTLQYRFRKIKEITGFDIYHIDDLVQLRLAVLQYRYFGI